MKVTKHNVCQIIEDYLNKNKYKFNILNPDEMGVLYEVFVGSFESNIQVEFNVLDNNNDYVSIQFFTTVDNYGNSFYHSDWDNEMSNVDCIESEIDNLITTAVTMNKALAKIQSKLDQIKDICEESGLIFDEIITINIGLD